MISVYLLLDFPHEGGQDEDVLHFKIYTSPFPMPWRGAPYRPVLTIYKQTAPASLQSSLR